MVALLCSLVCLCFLLISKNKELKMFIFILPRNKHLLFIQLLKYHLHIYLWILYVYMQLNDVDEMLYKYLILFLWIITWMCALGYSAIVKRTLNISNKSTTIWNNLGLLDFLNSNDTYFMHVQDEKFNNMYQLYSNEGGMEKPAQRSFNATRNIWRVGWERNTHLFSG